MPKGDYKISDIYSGGYSSINPEKYGNFTGYRMGAGEMGLTTDPRVANILQEFSSKLSTGVKQIEITAGVGDASVFDSIPKQYLKEVERLSKLTGVDVSVHAPIVEPSGFTKQGFSETDRVMTEQSMLHAIERAHEMNPKGNIPVTFHSSSGILPEEIQSKIKDVPRESYAVSYDGSQIIRVPLEKSNFPGDEIPDVKKQIENTNKSKWGEQIKSLMHATNIGDEALKNYGLLAKMSKGEDSSKLFPEQKEAVNEFNRASTYLEGSYEGLKELFNLASKTCSENDKKILDNLKKDIEAKALKVKENPDKEESFLIRKEIIDTGLDTLKKVSPKLFKPLEDFTTEKSTETFANVTLEAYKKFKNNTPIISIENPPAGASFSTGEQLKKLVEESRKKFVEKAVKDKILSESEAKKQAEKLIGVTWDVGHINMLRKHGYEAKDIVKETEKVAPLVKHVHLSDNFGFEHTELPMGMGNVPVKEMMEKLGKEGFEGKKIIEAASWWQHFKSPPVKESMEAFGSPLYSMNMAPYWNQSAGFQQNYFSGYGMMLPQGNYETFGAGFSQLPAELGGQRPGAQGGRMSGRGIE